MKKEERLQQQCDVCGRLLDKNISNFRKYSRKTNGLNFHTTCRDCEDRIKLNTEWKDGKLLCHICGEYKEGRYAWILDDIEEVNPIKAKGQLGIWNYYSEEEILSLMDNIEYGYVDNKGNKYTDDYQNFSSLYILSSPEEVIKNRVGVCFDQVELERYYFKNTCYTNIHFFKI